MSYRNVPLLIVITVAFLSGAISSSPFAAAAVSVAVQILVLCLHFSQRRGQSGINHSGRVPSCSCCCSCIIHPPFSKEMCRSSLLSKFLPFNSLFLFPTATDRPSERPRDLSPLFPLTLSCFLRISFNPTGIKCPKRPTDAANRPTAELCST